MNNLFTFKGRVILFLLLFFHFGLKLQASAHTRMVCDTDTTITKKGKNTRTIKADTSIILKAGSTIVKNADTILIINGVPTRRPINSLGVKTDSAAATRNNDSGAAKTDTIINSTSIVAPPTDGTIQVKNTSTTPTNTTIVAPPTDGTIQVRNTGTTPTGDGGTQGKNTSTGTTGNTDATGTAKTDATTGTTDATGGNKTDAGATGNPNATGAPKTDATTDAKKDTTSAKSTDKSNSAKTDSVLAKKGDTTVMKKADTTALLRDTTDETEIKPMNGFLEVGGPGLAISANYDTRFNKTRDGWGYRIGLGGFVSGGNRVVTVPFQVNFLVGNHSSMFEVGAGTTFLSSTGDNKGKTWEFDKITGFIATATFGYRYQPEQKGINFRLAFTPLLTDEGLIPAAGISIGYTFK